MIWLAISFYLQYNLICILRNFSSSKQDNVQFIIAGLAADKGAWLHTYNFLPSKETYIIADNFIYLNVRGT